MAAQRDLLEKASGLTSVAMDLGIIPYVEASALQEEIARLRAAGALPNILLLAEHPPTFTTGRFRGANGFKVSRDSILVQGAAICESDRGGAAVYHGPGQLLLYPILSLRELRLSIVQYVWGLEEVALQVLSSFHIQADRKPGYPGAWAGGAKIGFIGLHISRGMSKHGLALNVNPDLHYFDYIDCCGLPQVAVTSIAELAGSRPEMRLVKERALEAFSNVFHMKLRMVDHGFDN